jgi:hypothetical protein
VFGDDSLGAANLESSHPTVFDGKVVDQINNDLPASASDVDVWWQVIVEIDLDVIGADPKDRRHYNNPIPWVFATKREM